MTFEQALAMMTALADTDATEGDHEHSHSAADALLCDFLTDSGFGALVEQYERIERWFA